MNKHRKDHQALHEAYNNIQNQRQIDEKGGFFDRTLAASPIAGMFGGVSDRAKGRVGSRKDLDKLSKMFNREIGSMGKDVDAQQFKGWLSAVHLGIQCSFVAGFKIIITLLGQSTPDS